MIIVSGPSTIGKNPFVYEACKLYNLNYIVPVTTRIKRKEETDQKDYYFLSKRDFKDKIKNNEIIHWDYCLKNYYGYYFRFPGEGNQITHGLSRMALRIKALYPERITTIFFYPKNEKDIIKTLERIYNNEMLLLRKSLVEEELCHSTLFDFTFEVSDSSVKLLNNNKMKELLVKEHIKTSY